MKPKFLKKAGITIITLSLFQCSLMKQNKKTCMDDLNIKEIKKKVAKYYVKGSNKVNSLVIGNKKIKVRIENANNGFFDYREKDTVNNQEMRIEGNAVDGYKKTLRINNERVITMTHYFPNGVLKATEQAYLYEPHNIGAKISFPIGKFHLYNIEGQLIKTIDYDTIFKFNFNDVKKLIAERGGDYNLATINGGVNQNGPFWIIDFVSQTTGLCSIAVDAENSVIVRDLKHIQLKQN